MTNKEMIQLVKFDWQRRTLADMSESQIDWLISQADKLEEIHEYTLKNVNSYKGGLLNVPLANIVGIIEGEDE